jgi:hypothetical protein
VIPDVTATQIRSVRQRLTRLALDYGWVDPKPSSGRVRGPGMPRPMGGRLSVLRQRSDPLGRPCQRGEHERESDSASPASTATWSMTTRATSPVPRRVTDTSPPPAVPVTFNLGQSPVGRRRALLRHLDLRHTTIDCSRIAVHIGPPHPRWSGAGLLTPARDGAHEQPVRRSLTLVLRAEQSARSAHLPPGFLISGVRKTVAQLLQRCSTAARMGGNR